MAEGLTTKQRLFVEAYLVTSNATESARRAGYKGNDVTLGQVGAENLKKPQIAELLKSRVTEAIITADEVLTGIKTIALNGERDADRLKGYELLGKHLKLFTDKTEVTERVTAAQVADELVNKLIHDHHWQPEEARAFAAQKYPEISAAIN